MDIGTSIALGLTLIMVGIIFFVFSVLWLNSDGMSGRMKDYLNENHHQIEHSGQANILKRPSFSERLSSFDFGRNTED